MVEKIFPVRDLIPCLIKYLELLVERQNKEVVKVSAGEVSVRGLYSYIAKKQKLEKEQNK